MRALRIVAGAAILLGTIAACGQSGDQAPAAGNQQPPGETSSSSAAAPPSNAAEPIPPVSPPVSGPAAPPPGGTVVPKAQVDTSGMAGGSVPPPEVAVAPDGRVLTLTVMARDSCSGVEATVTEETDDAVKIMLTPMLGPQGGPPDQMCAQVLTPRQVTVQLKAPLGDRKLLISEGY